MGLPNKKKSKKTTSPVDRFLGKNLPKEFRHIKEKDDKVIMDSMKFREFLSLVLTQMEKHQDLVWMARKPPLDADPTLVKKWLGDTPEDIILGMKQNQVRVKESYPDEVEELSDPETGDFSHGFNSGVLAATRMTLMGLLDARSAAVDFPNLDT